MDSVLPLKSHRPLGDDRQFDILINESGFLRLTVPEMVVEHMGNRVPERLKAETSSKSEGRKPSGFSAIFELTLVKKVLMRVYNTIFNIYFDTER